MKAITDTIKFELNRQLKETATIELDDFGDWGFKTEKEGIIQANSWEDKPYDSFDMAYKKLKAYESNALKNLQYE